MDKHNLVLVSFSFVRGGAGIAANNFFNLAKNFPEFQVSRISQDEAGSIQFMKRVISWCLGKLQMDGNPTKHSLNLFSYSNLIRTFQKNPDHLYHLHWINNDTLSIWDLDKIPSHALLTLHDEWFYCGAEHYFKVGKHPKAIISGYTSKPFGEGFPWNYWVWKIKKKNLSLRNDLSFTVPSKWMLNRARQSSVLKDKTIYYLPNSIDTDLFQPASSTEILAVKQQYGIGQEDFVLSFGAIDGSKNPLKGGKELLQALKRWLEKYHGDDKRNVVLLCFGGEVAKEFSSLNVTLISTGFLKNRNQLAQIYSVSDLVLVPSLVESFGQVAAEASACETPVVCFETSGLMDIVIPNETGWVAKPFSIESFADQLEKASQTSSEVRKEIGRLARNHIEKNFSIPIVQENYRRILLEILGNKKQPLVS